MQRLAVLLLMLCPVWVSPVSGAPAGLIPETEAARILEIVDWRKAEEVEIRLADHRYTPDELTFESYRPYRIRMRNVGETVHDMAGGDFFRGIVAQMVQSNTGRVVTPYIRSIYIRPGQEIELWFVPVKAGEFSFFCSLPGHREDGMEGLVTIR